MCSGGGGFKLLNIVTSKLLLTFLDVKLHIEFGQRNLDTTGVKE